MLRNKILLGNLYGFLRPKIASAKIPNLQGNSIVRHFTSGKGPKDATTAQAKKATTNDGITEPPGAYGGIKDHPETKPSLSMYNESCKKPLVSPGDPPSVKPCPPEAQQKVDDCKKQMDVPPSTPGGSQDGPKNKSHLRNPIFLLLGLCVAAGVLYQLWRMDALKMAGVEIKKEKKRRIRRPQQIIKNPSTSDEIPDEVPYLLIGGGTASFSAFRAIKSIDPKAKVLVLSSEPYNPYMRPPLSKEMWYTENRKSALNLEFKQWNGTERSLFYEPEDFYTPCSNLTENENGGVSIAQGWIAQKIDVQNRLVTLDDGKIIKYDKCLIATGARPKTLPVFENADEEIKQRVTLFRGIFDFQELEEIIEDGVKSIAVVGGGFLGSELACALARRGKNHGIKVTQIFREDGSLGKILPQYLSKWTTKKVEAEGVEIFTNSDIQDIIKEKDGLRLFLNTGINFIVDHVIVAVGVDPNTELAATSGLELDPEHDGFLVNAELEARSHLYAAGDNACFYDMKLGRRRIEHHDHAVVSGRLAGENMTGAGKPFYHQSMFWSDLGPDVGFEAIGIVNSSLPTVGVYAKSNVEDDPESENPAVKKRVPAEFIQGERGSVEINEEYGKGVIFYLRDEMVVGILLWNVFNRMPIARQVLKDDKKYDDFNEVAKLFKLHG